MRGRQRAHEGGESEKESLWHKRPRYDNAAPTHKTDWYLLVDQNPSQNFKCFKALFRFWYLWLAGRTTPLIQGAKIIYHDSSSQKKNDHEWPTPWICLPIQLQCMYSAVHLGIQTWLDLLLHISMFTMWSTGMTCISMMGSAQSKSPCRPYQAQASESAPSWLLLIQTENSCAPQDRKVSSSDAEGFHSVKRGRKRNSTKVMSFFWKSMCLAKKSCETSQTRKTGSIYLALTFRLDGHSINKSRDQAMIQTTKLHYKIQKSPSTTALLFRSRILTRRLFLCTPLDLTSWLALKRRERWPRTKR